VRGRADTVIATPPALCPKGLIIAPWRAAGLVPACRLATLLPPTPVGSANLISSEPGAATWKQGQGGAGAAARPADRSIKTSSRTGGSEPMVTIA